MGKVSKELSIKKAKYKCMVRGCSNTTDVYSVSRTREAGHTVIMCAECAEMVAGAIEKYKAEYKPVEQRKESVSPFFSAGVAVEITELVVDTENTEAGTEIIADVNSDGKAEDIKTETDIIKTGELNCQYCGQLCGSKLGLGSHERSCKKKKSTQAPQE